VTPEQWQQVKKVLAAALERASEERQAYLDGVSAEPSLRREVESLIAAHEQGDSSFLERPAVEGGMLKSGTKLGPCEILALLGAGGMGEVYRARDTRLERDVAVKVLPPGLLADEAARRRFRNEALALAKLNHANIGGVYEFDRQGDLDFLVMEYVPGATLAERLTQGALPEKEVATLGTQIAAALEEAHEHGLVHRDLKPGNIMVTPKGQVKVLDFGLARLLRPMSQAAAKAETLSETQGLSGTLPYMAPEQLRGEPADARTDIHAAGAVLYEMATGQRPFSQAHGPQLIAAILNELPRPPRSLNPRVSLGLESAILKALDKEPENRYQSAKELGVDLRRLAAPTLLVVRPAARPRRVRRAALVTALAAAFLLAILVGLNLGGWRQRLLGKAAGPRIQSIAVLPLENLTGDSAQEYFADGMTDALITDLARISSLRVISRTSAMRYKGARKTLAEIAQELNVDAFVEGSVVRSANRVRINAQLIQAAPERHLWANAYERDLTDVVALQGDVARAVATEIQIKLTPQEQARLAGPRQVNPEAYEAYLKGRYYWEKRNEAAINTAIEYFEQAIKVDPNFALAYAGLADAYNIAGFGVVASMPRAEAAARCKAAAVKALELDNSLAEAHTALALLKQVADRDWAGAEVEFRRALELNPGYANAYLWYSQFLRKMGRRDEDLAMTRRALQLDPISPIMLRNMGLALWRWGDIDQAIEQFRKALEIDPNRFNVLLALGWAHTEKGMYAEATAELQKALTLSPGNTLAQGALAYVYAVTGRRAEAGKILNELKRLPKERGASYQIALIYVGLGRNEEALGWVEKAVEDRSIVFWQFAKNWELDPLRKDPRFQELMRRAEMAENRIRK